MKLRSIFLLLAVILGLSGFEITAKKIYPEPTAKDNLWGYAFMNGGFRIAIPYQFDDADSFDAELPRARVRIGDDYYLIDESGNKCAGPYERVSSWADPATGYYIITVSGKEGLINMNGAIILEPKYTNLMIYESGKVAGLYNGEYVEIDLNK
ncbi:MAG: WG repeat-containing protein [Muribaculaceae bacterium]|nr:WG repeat-containing protein [Muribaculaceae bacterium]